MTTSKRELPSSLMRTRLFFIDATLPLITSTDVVEVEAPNFTPDLKLNRFLSISQGNGQKADLKIGFNALRENSEEDFSLVLN